MAIKLQISLRVYQINPQQSCTQKGCMIKLIMKYQKKDIYLKSSLCDYNDAYILVKRTITVNNTVAANADADNTNKKVIFKNCAPFTNCISEINNTQVDNVKDIDTVMPMYNFVAIL